VSDGDPEVGVIKSAPRARAVLERVDASSRYGILFGLLLLTFALAGSLPTAHWAQLLLLLVESATLVVALLATGARRVFLILTVVLVGIGLIAGVANLGTSSSSLSKIIALISILLVVVAPVAVVGAVVRRRRVDLQTVLAALCFYVMLGLFFSTLFTGIQTVSGHPFFAQSGRGNSRDFLYYSFVSMTTVGYGDLTAASAPGRTLSASEAMLGQLYLVTVVSLLVANLRPARMERGSQAETTAAIEPGARAQDG
jgi:hypothetical protein